MTVLIGTDEAGYGPNLGPLVITATAWRLPAGCRPSDIGALLADGITSERDSTGNRLQIADSKRVYASGGSLERLECPVLAILRVLGQTPRTAEDLGSVLAGPDFLTGYREECCRCEERLRLPCDAQDSDVAATAGRLQQILDASGVRLLAVRSCVLFPPEFNRRIAAEESKGRVLSVATLQLVDTILQGIGTDEATVICDRHGGRRRYDGLLRDVFGDQFVFRMEEGRALSRYRLGRREFWFQTKAEQHLPVALASMVSKYVREIAMREFNAFWKAHLPELKPTMGYPVDAVRFMNDIESVRTALGIERSVLWRSR